MITCIYYYIRETCKLTDNSGVFHRCPESKSTADIRLNFLTLSLHSFGRPLDDMQWNCKLSCMSGNWFCALFNEKQYCASFPLPSAAAAAVFRMRSYQSTVLCFSLWLCRRCIYSRLPTHPCRWISLWVSSQSESRRDICPPVAQNSMPVDTILHVVSSPLTLQQLDLIHSSNNTQLCHPWDR